MDNHIQIENAKKPVKEEKKIIIFYSDATTPEGTDGKYIIVTGIEQAFFKTMELKNQGALKIVVFQQVNLKLQMG